MISRISKNSGAGGIRGIESRPRLSRSPHIRKGLPEQQSADVPPWIADIQRELFPDPPHISLA
jgi:hypothetical protein